jgi:hypothetical protein
MRRHATTATSRRSITLLLGLRLLPIPTQNISSSTHHIKSMHETLNVGKKDN